MEDYSEDQVKLIFILVLIRQTETYLLLKKNCSTMEKEFIRSFIFHLFLWSINLFNPSASGRMRYNANF